MKKNLILLIDDDINMLDYVQLHLQEFGYEVITAPDGVKGIQMIRQINGIEVIISDMQMPPGEWGGLWVIEQVKVMSGIPIIVLSEKGSLSKAVQALKAGAKDYVEKSLLEVDLIPKIEKILFEQQSIISTTKINVSSYYPSLQKALKEIWDSLRDDSKQFIANGEHIYHLYSHDINFDFSTSIIEFSKAIENECNNCLLNVLKIWLKNKSDTSLKIRLSNGNEVLLQDSTTNLTLGQIGYALKQPIVRTFCQDKGQIYEEIRTLITFLNDLNKEHRRNDAAHSHILDRKTFEILRSKILGIGIKSPLSIITKFA